MRFLIFLAFMAASPVLAQPALPLPQLYTVVGVAANDTLNIRQEPQADSADIGDLQPGQSIDVLAFSADGKWAKVSGGEATGWVAARFLALVPDATGDGVALPYGVPLHLQCIGAEPFWSADIRAGDSLTITDYSFENAAPTRFAMRGISKPVNVGPNIYGFAAPPYTGVFRRGYCDDGMSEAEYGWQIELLELGKDDVFMLSGCCTAALP